MIREQKIQFNSRFEQLLDECLNEMKNDLKNAKTQKEKNAIWAKYGLDIDDFGYCAARKTDALAVEMEMTAHLQRSADFLNKSRRHIQNHRR